GWHGSGANPGRPASPRSHRFDSPRRAFGRCAGRGGAGNRWQRVRTDRGRRGECDPGSRKSESASGGREAPAMTMVSNSGEMVDAKPYRRPLADGASPFIRLTDLVGRTIVRGLTRLRIEGLEHAHGIRGPLLVASNHASNADGVL